MHGSQSTVVSFGVQSKQLLTESQVLEQKVFPGTESADHPAEKMPEQYNHGENRTGIVRIELFAKSFSLWMYEVLARHTIRTKPDRGSLPAVMSITTSEGEIDTADPLTVIFADPAI